MLSWAMAHRAVVAVLAIAVIASSWPLYRSVRQDYLPSDVDEAEFDVQITGPQSASLGAMQEVMSQIDRDIRSLPSVRLVIANAGAGFSANVNQGQMYVRIAPHEERVVTPERLFKGLLHLKPWEAFQGNYSQRQVMQQVRTLLKKYPDLRTAVRNAPSFSIGGGNYDIDFTLKGPDLETLFAKTDELRKHQAELGLQDCDTTIKLDKPELRVIIDRDRAARLGVDGSDIAVALRIMVGGDDRVSRFNDLTVNDSYDVQLRLIDADRNERGAISRLFVTRRSGGLVRLDNLVKIVPAQSASRIDRLDRQRLGALRGSVAPGYALGDRLTELRKAFADMHLPAAYSAMVSGRGRELERTFKEFLWAFLLSVIFMYMILASQFESFIDPVTILLSLPLTVPFALASIWLSGNTLNLYSALGLLVLFGVVKKNSILQIDHTNYLRRRGMERHDAIMQANRDRLRPILMTTLCLVAGMLPLALGNGPGSEERRAVAVVVIGGQTLSLLLTLIVTPVAYSLFDDLRARVSVGQTSALPESRAI